MTSIMHSDSRRLFFMRNCPFCGCSANRIEATMPVSVLLESNPGYVRNWFTDETIAPSTVSTAVRCSDCGFVYARERLGDDFLAGYYQDGIDHEHSLKKIYSAHKRQAMIELWLQLYRIMRSDGQIKLLDYGGGWGDFLACARSIGVSVCGLEFDQRKIDFANNQGVPMGDLAFVRRHAPFDAFMCNQVLEHLSDPRDALNTLRGLLVAGAVGFISVPCYTEENLQSEIARLRHGELPSKDFDLLGHLNYFSPGNLREMVFKHGFVEIKPKQVQGRFARVKATFRKPTRLTTSIYVRAV